MTRINTNVSSLNAQKTLARSNSQLQQALTRLSTGLRINSGKDDPAGLIASEVLRADITSTQRAITNSQRANQMIATADSALGQISSLLNDIRGLVSEAANTGAMSAEQIAANQLQIDSSLEAIDRVAQVTQFQGQRLLDGNLDFITTGVSSSQISDLQIDQANFGTQNSIGVSLEVVGEAEKAALSYNANTVSDDVVLEVGGAKGFEAFSFAAGSTVAEIANAINLVSDALGVEATTGVVKADADRAGRTNIGASGGANLSITANTAGQAAGDVAIKFTTQTAGALAVDDSTAGVLDVQLKVSDWSTAASLGARDVSSVAGTATLSITANQQGAQFGGTKLVITLGGTNKATYDYSTNTITVDATAADTDAAVAGYINDQLGALFTAGDTIGGAVEAGDWGIFTDSATDYGTLDSSNTLSSLQTAIDALGDYTTSLSGDGDLKLYEYSATMGQANAGLDSDPNNGIQFLGVDGLSNTAINFVKSGASQPLSITFTENTATHGYSTAYLQGAEANATIKIAATEQGTEFDGVTVKFYDNTAAGNNVADRSVVYDKANKELKVYYDFANNDNKILASDLAAQIDASGLFDATAIGDGTGYVWMDQTASFSGGNKYTSINVNLATDANGAILSTADDVVAAINNSAEVSALGITAANLGSSTGEGKVTTGTAWFTNAGVSKVEGYASGTTYSAAGEDARMVVTAKTAGAAYDNVKVVVYNDDSVSAHGGEYVQYDANKKELGIYVDSGVSTVNDVLAKFNSTNNPTEYSMFSLSALGSGDGVLTAGDEGVLSGGMVDSGSSANAVELVENYDEGDEVGSSLQFVSAEYGSKQFVSVKALSGTFTTYNAAGTATDRDAGADLNVRINGIQAIADGLDVSLNTSALDMRFTLNESVAKGTTIDFSITGGGAQFQLGPDVVSNQQARIGITSVSTAKLGGASGRLYELRSGGTKSLSNDVLGAASVVEEVITQITNLRGRLGAFQKTTLDTNIASLSDTLETLTSAESEIRDADFASESASMTRAQILVQSGLSVLSMANQNPQNVLSLLR